jgi:outer membrane protein assembly factor BamE (lipoprotein component of BamABCDE complex)
MNLLAKRLITVFVLAIMLGGCTAAVHTRGNLVPDSKLARIKPNVSTQYDVSSILGPPTLVSPFEQERIWYYAGHQTETMGVFKQETVKSRLVRVNFDETGMVTKIEELDPEVARDIDFSNRKTDTAGKEFTFLQQLVGNLGRFNTPGATNQ